MTEHRANHKWWTLFAMCFALFMIMLDNTVVNVALPTIQRELHATPASLEWIVNGYILSFAALILLGGKLGDRFGRKRMFIVGVALFTAFSIACALSTTDSQLILFRVLQGTGAALMNPLSLSILITAFPRPQIPMAIGVWAGISGLGIAIGPVVGGFLVENYGWASVFWINGPVGVIAIAVAIWAVVESKDPHSTKLDVVGTALVTGGLFALTFGLIKTTDHSWTSPLVLGMLIGSAVLLVAWFFWERRVDQPMVPLGFFRIRQFTASNIVALLVGVALFGSLYFITLYFQNVKGYSAIEAGVRSMPLTLMILVVAPVVGRLGGKVGFRPLMTLGMALATVGMAGVANFQVDTSYNMMWPFFCLLGAGIAMTMPSLSAAAMSSVDPRQSGVASGVLNSARQVGGAVGIAVMGSVVAAIASNQFYSGAFTNAPRKLEPLVVGGQVHYIDQHAGPVIASRAADAFVQGMQGAMWAGAALTLLAALVSWFGLPRRPMTQHAPAGQPAQAPVAADVM
jgi:EmrB/QacA subfamily drug resistance transporter